MGRRQEREQAFFLIFESMFSDEERAVEIFNENVETVSDFAKEVFQGVMDEKDVIDDEISKYLSGWKLSRISKVNHAILLLSFYEIKKLEDVPNSVSINEAVELAKKYSGKDDASFINGVLGSYVRSFE